MDIREYLKKNTLLTDGPFGTYFSSVCEENILPEAANILYPDKVKAVHEAYVEAGAKLIRTNTFASNTESLACDRAELAKNIAAGWNIAKEAAKDNCFVAADIGQLPENADSSEYRFIADEFINIGADIFVFETLEEFSPIEDVVKRIKTQNENAFVIVQFCVNAYGYSSKGISAKELYKSALECPYTDCVGFNCGVGPTHMLEIMKDLPLSKDKFFSALPNANYPTLVTSRVVYTDNGEYFAFKIKEIALFGADIIGGCCGSTPRYIKKTAEKIRLDVKYEKPDLLERITHSEQKKDSSFFAGKGDKLLIAAELDPPRDGDTQTLMDTANYLKDKVDVITFADSPSGRTRAASTLMSLKVMHETGVKVMPHICCRDINAIGMRSQILGAAINGIGNLLVITGDPVPNAYRENVKSVFNFDSVRLMHMIGELNDTVLSNDPICYGGAINYARKNIDAEINRALKKEAEGCSFFLTQPVYADEDIKTLRKIVSRLKSKVLVGIMPLVSYNNANFIKNEITGINVPDELLARFHKDMSKEESRQVGLSACFEVMKKTVYFADGFYFTIPFNRLSVAKALIEMVGEL